MSWRAFLLGTAFFSLSLPALFAQEVPRADDLRFVSELRARGDYDLALEFLDKVAKAAGGDLAKEVPLERARIRLEAAEGESSTGKRTTLYNQSMAEIKEFMDKNPGHARASEAKLALAEVSVRLGRNQLAKAQLQDSPDAKVAEGLKARKMLEEAGQQLEASLGALREQLKNFPEPTTPADKARRARLEDDVAKAELAVALNPFDQAQTYFMIGKDETRIGIERAKVVEKSREALQKIAGKDQSKSVSWQAEAWLGRCYQETGEPKKARAKYSLLVENAAPPAQDARRLARYFRLLCIKQDPDPTQDKDPVATIKEAAARWLKDYPQFHKTPEGYGVMYLLADAIVQEADKPNIPQAAKNEVFTQARTLLTKIEASDNEYTEKARRYKLSLISKMGGFDKPVAALKTFEECYVRAQYEIFKMTDEEEKVPPAEREAKRKERVKTAIEALEAGLSKDDAKPVRGKVPEEVNNARALLAYYCLNAGRYQEAIAAGEALARGDVRGAQASNGALYAMQAYAQILGEKEKKFATPEEMRPDLEKMQAFAKFAEEAWPNETPGNLARHQLALYYTRQKKMPEAMARYEAITPEYPSYGMARYQLAEMYFQADQSKAEPLPGDKPGDYAARAVKVLEAIPESAAGHDRANHQAYVLGRARLNELLFRQKQYDKIDAVAASALKLLPTLDLTPEFREQIKNTLADQVVAGKIGTADAEFKAGKVDRALELLNPIVDRLNKGELPGLKKNPQLATLGLSVALTANVQKGDLDRARVVIQAQKAVLGEGADADKSTLQILSRLADLITRQVEELKAKDDKDGLAKMKKGFSAVLDDLSKQVSKPTPELTYLLGKNLGGLEEHEKAADLLGKFIEPANPEGIHKAIRILYLRELRLAKKYEEAAKVHEELVGKDGKGWGANHADVILERVCLLEDTGKYGLASREADTMLKRLLPKAEKDPAVKEKYLEFYYHVVYSFYKFGATTTDPAKADRTIKDAAKQMVDLEKKWGGWGSDASAKRFNDLLAAEPKLKTAYEAAKSAGN